MSATAARLAPRRVRQKKARSIPTNTKTEQFASFIELEPDLRGVYDWAVHGPVEVREAVEPRRSVLSPGGSISRPIRWPAAREPTSFRFVGDTGPEPRRTVLHKGAIARIMCAALFKSEYGAIVSPLVSTAPFTFRFLPANRRKKNPVAHG